MHASSYHFRLVSDYWTSDWRSISQILISKTYESFNRYPNSDAIWFRHRDRHLLSVSTANDPISITNGPIIAGFAGMSAINISGENQVGPTGRLF